MDPRILPYPYPAWVLGKEPLSCGYIPRTRAIEVQVRIFLSPARAPAMQGLGSQPVT